MSEFAELRRLADVMRDCGATKVGGSLGAALDRIAALERDVMRLRDARDIAVREKVQAVQERDAAYERAALTCEKYGESLVNEWNIRLGVADDLCETCDECAAAIRALKGSEHG